MMMARLHTMWRPMVGLIALGSALTLAMGGLATASEPAAAPAPAAAAAPAASPSEPNPPDVKDNVPSSVKKGLQSLMKLQEVQTGKKATVQNVYQRFGMYEVVYQVDGAKRPNVVHLSRDGELALMRGFRLKVRQKATQDDHAFATCLRLAGVRVLGNRREKETNKQLAALGAFSPMVLIDCGMAPKNCERLKPGKLPLILHGKDRFSGPRDRGFFASISGCPVPASKPAPAPAQRKQPAAPAPRPAGANVVPKNVPPQGAAAAPVVPAAAAPDRPAAGAAAPVRPARR